MQYASMQTLFDSLCQCLGSSATLPQDGSDPKACNGPGGGGGPQSGSPEHGHHNNSSNSPAATRRTNRLELKDKQWDALFDSVTPNINNNKILQQTHQQQQTMTHRHGGSPSSSPESSPTNGSRGRCSVTAGQAQGDSGPLETAHVLAKAKQAANPSRYHMSSQRDSPPPASNAPTAGNNTPPSSSRSHKRKRPTSSRDDIFRSRKLGVSTGKGRTPCDGDANCMNPISKFLSNHKGFANALCFATPVRDDGDVLEEEFKDDQTNANNDNNSLASEANTLNTCEDSMLLLDNKLAQMSKNQPPMPLFHDFKVNQNEPEGLRRIVETETHSSSNLMKLWRNSQNQQSPPQQGVYHHPHDQHGVQNVLRASSSSSSSSGANRGRARVRYPPAPPVIAEDEGGPPAMKHSSTSSSSESCPSHGSMHTGEI